MKPKIIKAGNVRGAKAARCSSGQVSSGSSSSRVPCGVDQRGVKAGLQSRGVLSLVDLERYKRSVVHVGGLGGSNRRLVKRQALSGAVAGAVATVLAPISSIFEAATVATVAGGALSGGLHAISGPDHIAALLPRCIGQRWWRAGKIALIWGSGHGFSTICLGMFMWSLKDRLTGGLESTFIPDLSRFTEGAVGFSLMLIGLIGLREARQWDDSELVDTSAVETVVKEDNAGNSTVTTQVKRKFQNGAIFVNGLLHGCSLDGLQTLAPALALSTWRSAAVFVLAHYLGTALSMSVATAAVGEGSLRVGKALKKPQIVRTLSRGSSFVAIVVGAIFAIRAIFGL
eukprot:CAMPEP_0184501730 /NCGR_PEP_ID=MMETSP0113_2-20130426/48441_1 /TAXON_ID=91329 /ORGANISM="Norrisiella sphaerica, Strain BC52" /LENGTH=342 /DNA_ID=CAMNT_0026890603 /DNA_START=257 /DNA_END=1285 /DNA_ORIENTATION=-